MGITTKFSSRVATVMMFQRNLETRNFISSQLANTIVKKLGRNVLEVFLMLFEQCDARSFSGQTRDLTYLNKLHGWITK